MEGGFEFSPGNDRAYTGDVMTKEMLKNMEAEYAGTVGQAADYAKGVANKHKYQFGSNLETLTSEWKRVYGKAFAEYQQTGANHIN